MARETLAPVTCDVIPVTFKWLNDEGSFALDQPNHSGGAERVVLGASEARALYRKLAGYFERGF